MTNWARGLLRRRWRYLGTSFDTSNFTIDGVNVWAHEWKDTHEEVTIRDPQYKQRFVFSVYEVDAGGTVLRFAAGEFSNGAWGFYAQDGAATHAS